MSINEMIARGYRRISNSAGLVARVDREDWREWMAAQHSGGLAVGHGWVRALGTGAADFYRRLYSRDRLRIGKQACRKIPTSRNDETGFVQIVSQENIRTKNKI